MHLCLYLYFGTPSNWQLLSPIFPFLLSRWTLWLVCEDYCNLWIPVLPCSRRSVYVLLVEKCFWIRFINHSWNISLPKQEISLMSWFDPKIKKVMSYLSGTPSVTSMIAWLQLLVCCPISRLVIRSWNAAVSADVKLAISSVLTLVTASWNSLRFSGVA